MASESETMLAEVSKIEDLIAEGEIGAHGVFTRMRYMLRSALESRAPSAEAKDAWQPIGTAPHDGTAVLLAARGPDSGCVVGWWDSEWGDGWWMCDDGKCAVELPLRGPEPTHWMPLPALPAIAQQGAAAAQEVERG